MTNSNQFRLWPDAVPTYVKPSGSLVGITIAQRFADFHGSNPWVYDALVKLAYEARRRGETHTGLKYLFEVLRWYYTAEAVHTDEPFRLNNDFTAHYSRMIMDRNPDLAGLFRVRRLRAA